jgi:hypothetical protein
VLVGGPGCGPVRPPCLTRTRLLSLSVGAVVVVDDGAHFDFAFPAGPVLAMHLEEFGAALECGFFVGKFEIVGIYLLQLAGPLGFLFCQLLGFKSYVPVPMELLGGLLLSGDRFRMADKRLISTMRATGPAAGPTHSFFELRARSLDVLLSGFRFLDGNNPANPFVARQRCNVLPCCPRR